MATETKSIVLEYPLYLKPGSGRGSGWRKPWSVILRRVDVPILDSDSEQWERSPAQIENGTVMEAPITLDSRHMTMEEILEVIDANAIEYALNREGTLLQKRSAAGE